MNKTIIATFVAAACVAGTPAFAASVNKTKGVNNNAVQARVNQAQTVLDQNSAKNDVSTFNWMDRITIGGLANLDAAWGTRTPTGTFGWEKNGSSSDININNINLFIDAKINSWLKAHINLAYLGDQYKGWGWPNLDKSGTKWGTSWLGVDEAYVDIGNFARTPFYSRIGKQYVGFGDYDRYPMITPLTQLLSETRATAIAVGAVTDMGVYLNASAFNGPTQPNSSFGNLSSNIDNFTLKLGYFGSLQNVGLEDVHYNIDASYIYNMYDIDALSPVYNYGKPLVRYPDSVGGIAVHADLTYGAWSLWGNYVQALGKMKLITGAPGGDIYAADIDAGYKFKTLGHESQLQANFQWSGDANIATKGVPIVIPNGQLPEYRVQLGYDVDVWKFTKLGIAWAHDWNYSGTGLSSNSDQIVGRLQIQF
jgi:hypothetical protein